jgi:hypothetical protein
MCYNLIVRSNGCLTGDIEQRDEKMLLDTHSAQVFKKEVKPT